MIGVGFPHPQHLRKIGADHVGGTALLFQSLRST